MLKGAADLVVGGVAFLVTLPLVAFLALLVKLTSPGPAFFRQPRVGRGGAVFHCLKLRTMVTDAQDLLERDPALRERHRRNGFKLPTGSDPRVTPLGGFLRRWHLDELPQLWNVLRGEMSLVGPRPIVPEELAHYGDRVHEFLSVRPGIFGSWTARGRARPDYPERTEVELSYVRNPSLGRDLRTLLRHIPVLARGQEDGEP